MTRAETDPHHQDDGEFDAFPSANLVEATLKSQDLLLHVMLDVDAQSQRQVAAELQRQLAVLSPEEFSALMKKLVQTEIEDAQLEAMRIVSVDQVQIIKEQTEHLNGWQDLVAERDSLAHQLGQIERRNVIISEALQVAILQSSEADQQRIYDALEPKPDTGNTPTVEMPAVIERQHVSIGARMGTHLLSFLRKEKPAA